MHFKKQKVFYLQNTDSQTVFSYYYKRKYFQIIHYEIYLQQKLFCYQNDETNSLHLELTLKT